MGDSRIDQSPLRHDGNWSYRDKLLGEISRAFEQAFDIDCSMETKVEPMMSFLTSRLEKRL